MRKSIIRISSTRLRSNVRALAATVEGNSLAWSSISQHSPLLLDSTQQRFHTQGTNKPSSSWRRLSRAIDEKHGAKTGDNSSHDGVKERHGINSTIGKFIEDNFPEEASQLGTAIDENDNDNDNTVSELLTTLRSEPQNTNTVECPKEGLQYEGVVTGFANFGVFVRLEGMDSDGLVHFSELSNDPNVDHPGEISLNKGDLVQVVVLPARGAGKLSLSMKRAKPVQPPGFQPCTVIAFGLPYDMEDWQIKETFENFGRVLQVDLSPSTNDWEEHIRKLAFITFETRAEALDCIQNLKQVKLELGQETHHFRIKVQISKKQTFRQELEARWDQAHEQQENSRNMKPFIRRRANDVLRDMIPSWDR